jgi:hypothetical protein
VSPLKTPTTPSSSTVTTRHTTTLHSSAGGHSSAAFSHNLRHLLPPPSAHPFRPSEIPYCPSTWEPEAPKPTCFTTLRPSRRSMETPKVSTPRPRQRRTLALPSCTTLCQSYSTLRPSWDSPGTRPPHPITTTRHYPRPSHYQSRGLDLPS